MIRLPSHLRRRDSRDLATVAGLCFHDDTEPGLHRRGRGRGFQFVDASGSTVRPPARDRLVALAVPPAWTEVWLAACAHSHLQATGRDDAGRKQYRYHEDFRALCEELKFEKLAHFPRALRVLRAATRDALEEGRPGDRRFALAAAIGVIDQGMLRVGNERSLANGARGATTLLVDDAIPDGDAVAFEFTGKSSKTRRTTVDDERIAGAIDALRRDPADDRLFWFEQDGDPRTVSDVDVNDFIATVAGDGFSARDYRTWGASVVALESRAIGLEPLEAVDRAAEALGNTRAVARASYIHPAILAADDAAIADLWSSSRSGRWFDRAESALAKLLESSKTCSPRPAGSADPPVCEIADLAIAA